jgi:hypothetical protein
MKFEMRFTEGKKTKTTVGVWRCPKCKRDREVLFGERPSKCACGGVIARKSADLDALIIEKKVTGYVCPLCNRTVPDTPMNWTGKTTDDHNAVMCPECHAVLNGRPVIHHGLGGMMEEEWSPFYAGTDYFSFRHMPCKDKEKTGICIIYAVLVDNQGRVIFNLQCIDCGAVDAIKTHTYFLAKYDSPEGIRHTIQAILLSPKLRTRIKEHDWDDV